MAVTYIGSFTRLNAHHWNTGTHHRTEVTFPLAREGNTTFRDINRADETSVTFHLLFIKSSCKLPSVFVGEGCSFFTTCRWTRLFLTFGNRRAYVSIQRGSWPNLPNEGRAIIDLRMRLYRFRRCIWIPVLFSWNSKGTVVLEITSVSWFVLFWRY